MANKQQYALLYATIEGRLLTEHAELSMTRNSNASPARSVAKGFCGVSPGAEDCEIDITNIVPAADFEYDAGAVIKANTPIEIGIIGPGGKTATTTGFVMSDSLSHGVGKEATYSIKCHCSFPEFQ